MYAREGLYLAAYIHSHSYSYAPSISPHLGTLLLSTGLFAHLHECEDVGLRQSQYYLTYTTNGVSIFMPPPWSPLLRVQPLRRRATRTTHPPQTPGSTLLMRLARALVVVQIKVATDLRTILQECICPPGSRWPAVTEATGRQSWMTLPLLIISQANGTPPISMRLLSRTMAPDGRVYAGKSRRAPPSWTTPADRPSRSLLQHGPKKFLQRSSDAACGRTVTGWQWSDRRTARSLGHSRSSSPSNYIRYCNAAFQAELC